MYLDSLPGNAENVVGALAYAMSDSIRLSLSSRARDQAAAAALIHLTKYPGLPVEALRAPLELTHSGCVRLVDRLERAGMVERRSAADGRCVAVFATRKGQSAAGRALARRGAVLRDWLRVLSPSERATLATLAGKVLQSDACSRAPTVRVCRACDYAACERCPMESEPW